MNKWIYITSKHPYDAACSLGINNADDLYWWYVTFTLDTIALNDYD